MAGRGMAGLLGCTRSWRAATRADGRGQPAAPPRPRTSGGMLAQSRAGMTAGVGRRDGATCLPPPAGNPVQAGDARGWYYPCAPHTGQAPMPWPARTRWATAICCSGRGGQVRRRGVPAAAVAEPGLLGELQPAVEAVAGASGPVPAGLTGRDRGPVRPARRRRRWARGLRRRGRSRRRAGRCAAGAGRAAAVAARRRGPATAAPGLSSAGPAAGLRGSGPGRGPGGGWPTRRRASRPCCRRRGPRSATRCRPAGWCSCRDRGGRRGFSVIVTAISDLASPATAILNMRP